MSIAEKQKIVIVILLAVGFIALSSLLVIIIYRHAGSKKNKHHRRDMFAKGGADLETGQILDDNNFFRGMRDEDFGTVLVSGDLNGLPPAITLHDTSGRSCSVTLSTPLTIGRIEGQGRFKVSDQAASREHAVIFARGKLVYIQDNHSSNHTFLNGRVVKGATKCNSGDVIRVGKTDIHLNIR